MKKYNKNEAVLTRIMDDETLLIEVDTGMCHVLNDMGGLIWSALENSSFDDIEAYIKSNLEDLENYNRNEIKEYLHILHEKGPVNIT